MCLIIRKPVGSIIPESLLVDAFTKNHDGYGVFWSQNNHLRVIHGFDLEKLIGTVDAAQTLENELFVHLRFATHGDISLNNVHPFRITDDILMAHNGVIDIARQDRSYSDTAVFCDLIRPMLASNSELIFNTGFHELVRRYIGDSRIVFLHSSGKSVIINQSDGIQWQGLWLSNTYAWSLWNTSQKRRTSAVFCGEDLFTYDRSSDDDACEWHLAESDRTSFKPKSSVTYADDAYAYGLPASISYLQTLSDDELYAVIWDCPDIVIDAIRNG